MFPGPTELLLIGCSIESTWTEISKSSTSTPKTNSQTFWQLAISHVMKGTIFSICSISAFSAQQAALKWCRKECNWDQEKRELWQSRSRRWTWFRVLWQDLLQRRARVHPIAQGHSEHLVRNVRISQHTVQGNLPVKVWTLTTRTTRSGCAISAYLVLTYHIVRKSTRIWDDNSNASTEIHGISVVDWQDKSWKRTTLLTDRAVQQRKSTYSPIQYCAW